MAKRQEKRNPSCCDAVFLLCAQGETCSGVTHYDCPSPFQHGKSTGYVKFPRSANNTSSVLLVTYKLPLQPAI